MAKCYISGAHKSFGNRVSHSHHISKRCWKPNLRHVKIKENGTVKRVYVTARILRTGLLERA